MLYRKVNGAEAKVEDDVLYLKGSPYASIWNGTPKLTPDLVKAMLGVLEKYSGDYVICSKAEYSRLYNDADNFYALQAHGVDNWCGYDDAMGEPDD